MSEFPFKRPFDIVLGFDTVRKTVKFLCFHKLEFVDSKMWEFPYKQQFLSNEFMEEFKQICKSFAKLLPSNRQTGCYVSLPNLMVTMDNVTLPQMRRKKLNSALQCHLQNFYKNYKELQFNSFTLSSNKKQTSFYLMVIKKTFLNNLYGIMSENRLYSRGTSFVGNCIVNSALYFKSNYRKKNFIFLDIHEAFTNVSVCLKGRTAGFSTLLFGTDRLTDDHRCLPKSTVRPEPTDFKGNVYENFREFIKWASLYHKQLQSQNYMPPIDCVIVNLPREFSFVIDMANAEEENDKLPFEYFDLSEKEDVVSNLDMIGALFCNMYNKKANF